MLEGLIRLDLIEHNKPLQLKLPVPVEQTVTKRVKSHLYNYHDIFNYPVKQNVILCLRQMIDLKQPIGCISFVHCQPDR